MGNGIAYLPTSLVFSEIKDGELVRILPEWRSAISPVHFVYPAQRFVAPKLSSFIDHAFHSLKASFKKFETLYYFTSFNDFLHFSESLDSLARRHALIFGNSV